MKLSICILFLTVLCLVFPYSAECSVRSVGTSSNTLLSIDISGPSSVYEYSVSQFSVEALYSGGNTVDVTNSVTWSVDPSIYGYMTSDGIFHAGPVPGNRAVGIRATFNGKSDQWVMNIYNRDISSIVIQGDTYVYGNTTVCYTAMVYYSNGDTENITDTGTWSENSSYLYLSGNELTVLPVSSNKTAVLSITYQGVTETKNLVIISTPIKN